jgi:2-dehydropantoate 2-reductase
MDVLVYGAGVLGSLYAARLHDSGCRVSIFARGQRHAELQQHGIVLEDARTGQQTTTRVQVVEQIPADESYDVIVVLVRADQLAATLLPLAANRRAATVLFMTNNVEGPVPLMEMVGAERVMLGFPGAGGTRVGHVVRFHVLPAWQQPTTLGELDGRDTPRLQAIVAAFGQAGFPVTTSGHMDAWLKTHATWITAASGALYMAGGDIHRLAHTRDALALMVRAVREGFEVLAALGYPVAPGQLRAFQLTPEPLMVALLQRLFDTETADLVVARHANAARAEIAYLAHRLEALAARTTVSTPARDRLFRYLDPEMPPLAEGSAEMPLHWRGTLLAAGGLAGLALVSLAAASRLVARRRPE